MATARQQAGRRHAIVLGGSMAGLGTARALIWMSQLAYETADPGKVGDILGSWQMRLPANGIVFGEARSVLPIASTHAIVASGCGATILSFAGTDPISLANWVSDFNFRTAPGSTADGFRQAYDAVRDKVVALMRARPADEAPLFVTGHSKGGALANLAAWSALKIGQLASPIRVYTIAAARAGDADFRTGFETHGAIHCVMRQ